MRLAFISTFSRIDRLQRLSRLVSSLQQPQALVISDLGGDPKMTTAIYVTGNEHLEEFWAEDEASGVDEDRGNATDEGELEADWLSEVGLGEWTVQWRQGKSLPESDIAPAVQKLSLKPHQAEAVRRRVRTLNATLKRKKNKRVTPDVRSFFQGDSSDHKDSSRSATPDSLDSGEFLEGHSPPRRHSSPAGTPPHDGPDDGSSTPAFVSIFEAPPTSSSPSSRSKELFKPQFMFPGRGASSTDGEIASDVVSGIEILNYHNVGTIYMRGYIKPKPVAPLSLPPQIDSRTYSASSTTTAIPQGKNGFVEELSRRSGGSPPTPDEDELVEENGYVEPSGLTRLSDLSEEDVKTIKKLLLMELTAQCDLVNIQVRMKKGPKPRKSGSGSIPQEEFRFFGVSLEVLLARDQQKYPESQLEIPIVFDKLLSHLWKKSLSEEGLLRIAGNKSKMNELRAVIEANLYEAPEQVDAAMSACSSHDVASLLKQFLRELPVPLLGYEYIDVFFEVAGSLRGRSQESCLRLLILLLPLSHQAVIRVLVSFLRDLVRHSLTNKMSLTSVATIVAPNLAPSSALASRSKELTRAAQLTKLTQSLIRHGSNLFAVPADLVSQLRQINEKAQRVKKARSKGSGMNKCMHPNQSVNSVASILAANGPCAHLVVSAPQLGFTMPVQVPIQSAGTTAGDIVISLLDEADRKAEEIEASCQNQRDNNIRRRPRGAPEVNRTGPNLSCLLTKVNRDLALKTHSLYEIGGNIGYRRIDPSALLPSICRDNPSANWVLRCNHRHSSN